MYFSPQVIRVNGTTVLTMLRMSIARKLRPSRGQLSPRAFNTTLRPAVNLPVERLGGLLAQVNDRFIHTRKIENACGAGV